MINETVNLTAKFSLISQVIIGLVDMIALQVKSKKIILKQLLTLELFVQMIEFMFYLWLIYKGPTDVNTEVTKYRYYDWFISTNVMLFTFIVYIVHLQFPEKNIREIYNENKGHIHSVIYLNTIMLLIGYLGEIKKINMRHSVYMGFIPFFIYYGIIYNVYVKKEVLNKNNVDKEKQNEINLLFWYFFIVWSIYGISALFPYNEKNVSYNILDIFSKNFFGLFLSWKVFKDKI
jgi:hypothetical protein